MSRIIFTEAADADAASIFDELYTKAGKPTVVKYRASFKILYDNLAAFPDSGAPRPNIGAGIRIGIVSPYIVITRHAEPDGVVTVLRIVHGRRRITGKMLRSAP